MVTAERASVFTQGEHGLSSRVWEGTSRETDPPHTFHGVPAIVSCKLLNYITREPGTRPGKDLFIIPDLEDWLDLFGRKLENHPASSGREKNEGLQVSLLRGHGDMVSL